MIYFSYYSFFLRLLTDQKVTNMTDLLNAIEKLHEIGPQIVAVSSTDFNDKLTALVSTAKGWLNTAQCDELLNNYEIYIIS